MKTCSKCRQTKSYDEFYKNKSTVDGLAYQCKKCANVSNKLWYEKTSTRPARVCMSHAEKLNKRRDADRKRSKIQVAKMCKKYIAARLKIPASKISDELLELKSEQLSIKRLIWNLTKEIKNGTK